MEKVPGCVKGQFTQKNSLKLHLRLQLQATNNRLILNIRCKKNKCFIHLVLENSLLLLYSLLWIKLFTGGESRFTLLSHIIGNLDWVAPIKTQILYFMNLYWLCLFEYCPSTSSVPCYSYCSCAFYIFNFMLSLVLLQLIPCFVLVYPQASYFTFHFLCLSVFPLVFCVHLCLICLLNLGLWSGASLLPFCYLYFDLFTFDFCCLGPILIELWHTIPEWRQSKNFNVQRNFLTCFSAVHMTIKALTLTWNHFPTWSLCQYFLFPAV